MNNLFASIGDVRASDQTLRLHFMPKNWGGSNRERADQDPIGELWEGRGTFVHEWVHYLQFSITPAGWTMSKMRRDNFERLLRVVGRLKGYAIPLDQWSAHDPKAQAELTAYYGRLRQALALWRGWGQNWYAKDGTEPNVIDSWISPTGVNALLSHQIQRELTIGPFAMFESCAWLVEKFNSTLLRDDIPRSAGKFLYTWSIMSLARALGMSLDDEEVRLKIGMDMIAFLMAASFYDPIMTLWTGKRNNLERLARKMQERRVTPGRVVFECIRRYKQLDRCFEQVGGRDDGVKRAYDLFFENMGLPKLSEIMALTHEYYECALAAHEKRVQVLMDGIATLGFGGDLRYMMAEWDLLRTSVTNMSAARSDVESMLSNPYQLAKLAAPPLCAYLGDDGYKWGLTNDWRPLADAEREHQFERLMLRQFGSAIFEHILFMLVHEGHIACYGSPDWGHPIVECEFAVECRGIAGKKGLAFCKNPDWRRQVASVLRVGLSGVTVPLPSDGTIPGIEGAFAEYDLAKERNPDAAGTGFDFQLLGAEFLVRFLKSRQPRPREGIETDDPH
jgi:hypothetical protein